MKSWKKLSKNGHDIGKELNIDYKTVLNHLEKSGYKNKLHVWIPNLFITEKFHESNFFGDRCKVDSKETCENHVSQFFA